MHDRRARMLAQCILLIGVLAGWQALRGSSSRDPLRHLPRRRSRIFGNSRAGNSRSGNS